MKRPADGAAAGQTHPESPRATSDRQTLADALVAHALELRMLHEQYKALPHDEAGGERRDMLLRFLHSEQAVMKEAMRLLEQLDALLRADHERLLRARNPNAAARLPDRSPDARDT